MSVARFPVCSLGTLEKLRNANINFVMFVCLSVCPHGINRHPWTDFRVISCRRVYLKSVQIMPILFQYALYTKTCVNLYVVGFLLVEKNLR